jgi:peptide/nickel transport system substrate-binding protein
MAIPAALAVLAAALVSCGGPSGQPGTLIVAGQGWPISLVPHGMPEIFTIMAQSNIYEGLVEFDPRMRVSPLLAENWETPDPRTWVFRLRRGVTFHDGSPLRAEDVVFSLRRAKEDSGSSLRANFVQIESIEAGDGQTVRITTKRPFPLLLYKLVSVFIVPEKAFTALGPEGFGRSPVGTGPYLLKDYPPGGPLVLKSYPGYWGRKPAFGELKMTVVNGDEEIGRLLESGGAAAVVPMMNQATARRLDGAGSKKYRIHHRSGLVLRYLGFRWGSKPLRQPLVRQALQLAVDREDLVKSVCYGYGSPANQPVPPTVFGCNGRLPPLPYDPARAAQMLREAGFPQGLDLALAIPEQRMEVGRRIKEHMAAAGIRLELKPMSREVFFRALDTASLFYIGYGSTSGDASDLLDEALHSKRGGYGVNNYGGYANPGVDRLIEISDTCFSQERRLELIQQAMELACRDVAMVPLFIEDQVSGASAGVVWTPRLDMMVLGKEVGYVAGR